MLNGTNPMIFKAALCLVAISTASSGSAQTTFGCPDQNTMTTDAKSEGSDSGVSCGNGIGFTFGGVTYAPSNSKCPSSLTYTPPRELPSGQLNGFMAVPNTPVEVTKQDYACTGIGCGILWLEGCCRRQGNENPVNTLSTFLLMPCPAIPEF